MNFLNLKYQFCIKYINFLRNNIIFYLKQKKYSQYEILRDIKLTIISREFNIFQHYMFVRISVYKLYLCTMFHLYPHYKI